MTLEPTFTLATLCERWHCGKSRVYDLMTTRDFPTGSKLGRHRVWSQASIYEWERKHLPAMQSAAEDVQDDEEWETFRRELLAQMEEMRTPAPETPKRRANPARRHR